MADILLLEPDYKNKYPPLGLMKISTYHKQKGDDVTFFKGKSKALQSHPWDRIYISTLFTFYWNKTIDTIKYYRNSVKSYSDVYVGGVMATLLAHEIAVETGATVVRGLLDKPGMLGEDKVIIDSLPPDYSIIYPETNPHLDYNYPTNDSYIAYTTRGCIRKCHFCAVHKIEPDYKAYFSLKDQIKHIKENYGEKRNLLLLDNNVLASEKFNQIVADIVNLGFAKGAKFTYEKNGRKVSVDRHVDFNQGIDARILTEDKMELLSKIAIKPLRIAFDDIKYRKIYIEKVRLAAKCCIESLSNYILFNFEDRPEDFYERLKINIELNEEFAKQGLKSRIWSFPMKYSPLEGEYCKNRKHVGNFWDKKLLRGIQCVLLATHGVVGPRRPFFERAFGKDITEFKQILYMPENYIIYREEHEKGPSSEWKKQFNSLSKKQENDFIDIIKDNKFDESIYSKTKDYKIKNLLSHYIKQKSEEKEELQLTSAN